MPKPNTPVELSPVNDGGPWAVLTTVLDSKTFRAIGSFPRPLVAFQFAKGHVVGYVTANAVYPVGTPLWTPDGTVEIADDEWESKDVYDDHLRATVFRRH